MVSTGVRHPFLQPFLPLTAFLAAGSEDEVFFFVSVDETFVPQFPQKLEPVLISAPQFLQ
jgi:hypothetical protein